MSTVEVEIKAIRAFIGLNFASFVCMQAGDYKTAGMYNAQVSRMLADLLGEGWTTEFCTTSHLERLADEGFVYLEENA